MLGGGLRSGGRGVVSSGSNEVSMSRLWPEGSPALEIGVSAESSGRVKGHVVPADV